MTAQNKGVAMTHSDYDKFAPKWERARDVIAGQDAMHAKGEKYLPKLTKESDPDYKARKCRSDFFNGTWRTIDGLGGMAFRKPPTVDVPKAVEALLEDVTMSGMDMDAFAAEVVEDVLSTGRVGVLVDHPTMPANVVGITVAAAEKIGLRPMLQLYRTESIINWKFARIGNTWSLAMAVLKEVERVPDGEFAEKEEERWRVLDLDGAGHYRQRVYRKTEKGEDEQVGGDIYPLMNNAPLNYIPFAIIGTSGRADEIDEPPLIDLIDKNIAHYQVNSDYRHGLHFTGLPTLFLSGMTQEPGEEFYVGSAAAITSPHPDAKGEFIEFTGQGLQAIEKALDRIEKQMALLGARMIADESQQVETLGATQIKRSGENSVLAKIVQAVSSSLEWALTVFSQWAGQSGEVVYRINRDFNPALLDAQQITALLGAVQAGELSSQEFYELLQRGDVVDSTKPFDEHQAEIEVQGGPARPVVPAANDEVAA